MTTSSRGRPGESDATFLVLGAIALIVLLIVAGAGVLGVLMWHQTQQMRMVAEEARMEAEVARDEAMRRHQEARHVLAPDNNRKEPQRDLPGLRPLVQGPSAVGQTAQAGGLVAVPAAGPWPLLPLLAAQAETGP